MLCPTCGRDNPSDAPTCAACATPLGAPPPPTHFLTAGSSLLDGAYSIGKVLGQGGFGITYQGSDLRLRRPVAIKEFFPYGSVRHGNMVQPAAGLAPADFQAARVQFLDEAATLARFTHPGIVRVYTSFEENNTAYMVMELLLGKTLLQLVEERGPLPEQEAIAYIEQAGAALAVVHAANLLHRDIKPDNLVAIEDGRVVLVDFGTAREFAAGRTRRMTAMLTPGYAPLEQYSQQARFGPFTDIYALGGTLYYLLTGQAPPAATDRIQGVSLPPPHVLNPGISRVVSDAVTWALEMQVQGRPQSASEFLGALRRQTTRPRPAPAGGAARKPFRFENGEASTLGDLIDLCDRYWDEAQHYLFNGRLERWLEGSLGEARLARKARDIAVSHRRSQRVGLELFVRELCKAVGEDPLPRLVSQPDRLELGQLPQGARASESVRLRNTGRGHAWGSVRLEPSTLRGVSVTGRFDSANAAIEVRVDTLNLPPGAHAGSIVVSPEGTPAPLRIPVSFEVLPLQVSIEPGAVDLGKVPYGDEAATSIWVTSAPPGGRLSGTASLKPFIPGARITSSILGPEATLEVALDTRGLESGKRYETEVQIETNAGAFRVPVRFRVGTQWGPVALLAGRAALVVGAGAATARMAILAVFGGAWVLTPRQDSPSVVAASVFALLLLAAAVSLNPRVRAIVGRLGRFWPLALLGLCCCSAPAFLGLPYAGMWLILALDTLGLPWSLLGLPPAAAWGLNGVLFGILFGAASALGKAGRINGQRVLSVNAIILMVALALWGWTLRGFP
jgi:serine/threonine protein kinase